MKTRCILYALLALLASIISCLAPRSAEVRRDEVPSQIGAAAPGTTLDFVVTKPVSEEEVEMFRLFFLRWCDKIGCEFNGFVVLDPDKLWDEVRVNSTVVLSWSISVGTGRSAGETKQVAGFEATLTYPHQGRIMRCRVHPYMASGSADTAEAARRLALWEGLLSLLFMDCES